MRVDFNVRTGDHASFRISLQTLSGKPRIGVLKPT
jgi:hypothetical protein